MSSTSSLLSYLPGYFGVAFVNTVSKQIVVAHKGTDSKHYNYVDILSDIFDVFLFEQSPSELPDALSFFLKVQSSNSGMEIYNTGHSLGCVLAELVGAMTHTPAMGFDCPGSLDIMENMEENHKYLISIIYGSFPYIYMVDLNWAILSDNIIEYNTRPNAINTCNSHVGKLHMIYPDISNFDYGCC